MVFGAAETRQWPKPKHAGHLDTWMWATPAITFNTLFYDLHLNYPYLAEIYSVIVPIWFSLSAYQPHPAPGDAKPFKDPDPAKGADEIMSIL